MKKLMLIYYNIVAVLTILYLVLTTTLMNLGILLLQLKDGTLSFSAY